MPVSPTTSQTVANVQTATSFLPLAEGVSAALDAHGHPAAADIATEVGNLKAAADLANAAAEQASQPDAPAGAVDTLDDAAADLSQIAGNLADAIDTATNIPGTDNMNALGVLSNMLNKIQDAIDGVLGNMRNGGQGGSGGAGGGSGGGMGPGAGPNGGDPSWQLPNPTTPPPSDPLVLDLDGDGLELVSVTVSSANFDLNADGFRERVGWLSPDDGFLVHDLNSNGSVDGVDELFGSSSVDGFVPLAQLDQNADGRVDNQDAAFSKLAIWRDLNGNGLSESGEVQTVVAAGITSVAVVPHASGAQLAGNTIGFESSFNRADGTTGVVGSAYFSTNPTISVWTPPPGFVVDPLAGELPNLRGYGTTPDLRYAMTLDAALRESVADLVRGQDAMDGAELREAFEDIVAQWTNTEGTVAGSRGANVDAQHLAVVEKIFGSDYALTRNNVVISTDPNAVNGAVAEASYQRLISEMLLRFEVQAPISSIFIDELSAGSFVTGGLYGLSGLKYDLATDTIEGDLWAAVRVLATAAPETPAEALDYIDRVLTALEGTRWSYFENDTGAYADFLRSTIGPGAGWYLAEYAAARAGGADRLEGTATADALNGTALPEIIVGDAGNDTLSGAQGADTYLFNAGHGHDVVAEGNHLGELDQIVLGPGLSSTNVLISRSLPTSEDVDLSFAGDSGSIRIVDGFRSGAYGVEEVVFSDGVAWSKANLREAFFSQLQTTGDDTILGFNIDDSIAGGGGNDSISGLGGNDTLAGGAGDDILRGGSGSDTYTFASGEGADTISDVDDFVTTMVDRLVLGTGLNTSNLVLTRSTTDLEDITLSFGTGGSITLDEQFDGSTRGIEEIQFGDGTVWSRADLINGYITQAQTAGDDLIKGVAGSNTYAFNALAGSDTISETSDYVTSSVDRLALGTGLNTSNLVLTRSATDLEDITLSFGTGGSITLDEQFDGSRNGIEEIQFGDGTVWTRADLINGYLTRAQTSGDDTINGTFANDSIAGGGGNDSLTGGTGADTLVGGAGADTLAGGDGSDLYIYTRGDGSDVVIEGTGSSTDKLVLTGINPSDVTLLREGNDVTLVVAEGAPGLGDGGSVKLLANLEDYLGQGVDQILFADGTIWTRSDLRANLVTDGATSGADTLVGTNSQDSIAGGGGNDSISGLGGNDTLAGGAGDDILRGGSGSDTYTFASGEGADTISDVDDFVTTMVDRLVLGTGLNTSNLVLTRSTTDLEDITLSFGTGGSITLDEQFDGSTRGIEEIQFGDGTVWTRADLINGYITQAQTAGDDLIKGVAGSTTYAFNALAGSDTISETYDYVTSSVDRLVLGTGLNTSSLVLTRSATDLEDITLSFGTGGSITLDEQFDGSRNGIEEIQFGDGTVWTRADLINGYITQAQTAGDDLIKGVAGSTTYAFNALAGSDTISETYDVVSSSVDRLVLGAGLNTSNLVLTRSATDLEDITLSFGTGGSITLDEQFDGSRNGIEEIQFGDGTVWTRADLINGYLTRAQTSGDDTINGTFANDSIAGGGGNDSLTGGTGADTLVGGAGADTLAGGDGRDRFIFETVGVSPPEASDLIADFSATLDLIDLTAIDADTGAVGDQAFAWIGTSAFSNVSGQLRYATSPSGARTVLGDVNGDGVADFQVQLTGNLTLTAGSFVL